MEGNLALNFLSWWYGERFVQFLVFLKRLFVYIYDLFSVEICVKTLFGVWRRDEISYENLSFQEMLQAWGLNIASRIIGLLIKLSTLSAYLIFSVAAMVAFIVSAVIWLGFPLVLISLLIFSFSYKF